jgi:hypothetical protein
VVLGVRNHPRAASDLNHTVDSQFREGYIHDYICGDLLAIVEGSLPKWKREKWACPKKGGATVTITQGNGSRHAMVIVGKKGVGLDLEILALGTRTAHVSRATRVATAVLTFLWILLMISGSGLKIGTWCKSFISLLDPSFRVDVSHRPARNWASW